ncbi:Uncharacterised protein [BD1-7 clade bacterium]|nr:Uncharacterised protein [BD1-7 clade bacterium]
MWPGRFERQALEKFVRQRGDDVICRALYRVLALIFSILSGESSESMCLGERRGYVLIDLADK